MQHTVYSLFRSVRQLLTAFIVLFFLLPLPSCRVIQTPEYRAFKELKLSQVGLKESTLSLKLVYFNPNPFGYKIKNFSADIYVDGIHLGKTNSSEFIHVAKKADFSIPMEIKVNMKNIPLHSLNLLLHKKINIRLSGSALVGVNKLYKEIPIQYEGEQELKIL
ncbi:MAG: LEA type 2 family protein [Bacteroidetes bacterium]|nr:LEA type 2 family protein [Bacteroidota bacterium]